MFENKEKERKFKHKMASPAKWQKYKRAQQTTEIPILWVQRPRMGHRPFLLWPPVPWLQDIPDRARHTRSVQNLQPKYVIQRVQWIENTFNTIFSDKRQRVACGRHFRCLVLPVWMSFRFFEEHRRAVLKKKKVLLFLGSVGRFLCLFFFFWCRVGPNFRVGWVTPI